MAKKNLAKKKTGKKPVPKTSTKNDASATPARSTFLGLPGTLRWPGWDAIGANMWDKSRTAAMFPPKVWGFGWSFNFAYPLIKSKPLWKRVLAFSIGILAVVIVMWALLSIILVAFYAIEAWLAPPEPIISLTLV